MAVDGLDTCQCPRSYYQKDGAPDSPDRFLKLLLFQQIVLSAFSIAELTAIAICHFGSSSIRLVFASLKSYCIIDKSMTSSTKRGNQRAQK